MRVKKFYIGDWKNKQELDLNTSIVLEMSKGQLFDTTIYGLIQRINAQEQTIEMYEDALLELGKQICPICGRVCDEDEVVKDANFQHVCKDCYCEGE